MIRTVAYSALGLLGLILLGLGSNWPALARGHDEAEGAFTGTAALLEIGVGARPLGMGGAFTGLSDDENAAFYNPAALAFLTARGLTSLYTRQFELLDYSAIGLAGPSLGLQFLQLQAGVERTNEFGNPDGSSFSYLSRAGVASLGLKLGLGRATPAEIGLGARLKLYQEVSDGSSGFGWALDPAVMVVLSNRNRGQGRPHPQHQLRLGAVLQNGLQGAIRFSSGHIERWEPDLRLGSALSMALREGVVVNLLFDLSGLLAERPRGQLGAELWLEGLGLRAGLDGEMGGLSLTLGSSVWWKALRADWAYTIHPLLPDTSRISLTLRF